MKFVSRDQSRDRFVNMIYSVLIYSHQSSSIELYMQQRQSAKSACQHEYIIANSKRTQTALHRGFNEAITIWYIYYQRRMLCILYVYLIWAYSHRYYTKLFIQLNHKLKLFRQTYWRHNNDVCGGNIKCIHLFNYNAIKNINYCLFTMRNLLGKTYSYRTNLWNIHNTRDPDFISWQYNVKSLYQLRPRLGNPTISYIKEGRYTRLARPPFSKKITASIYYQELIAFGNTIQMFAYTNFYITKLKYQRILTFAFKYLRFFYWFRRIFLEYSI